MKKKIATACLTLGLISLFQPAMVSAKQTKDETAAAVQKSETLKAHNKTKAPHWGYTGDTGPLHWGDLSAQFTRCKTGKNQSPVDLTGNLLSSGLPSIHFDYNMLTPLNMVNNGHTVQVNMWSGGEIIIDNIKFTLKQFHFHTPSENTYNGKHFPMEAHFVHQSEKGELAVVAMMFIPGKPEPVLNTLWEKLPMKAGETVKLRSFDLKLLDMDDELTQYYRFNGSLTTPPCSEGVRWIVMKKPFKISQQQVLWLQKALGQPNNRPTQPLGARVVVETK